MTAKLRNPSHLAAGGVALCLFLAACGGSDKDTSGAVPKGGKEVTLTIGYQSKTINTVTAGTLMRDLGLLEKRLGELGKENGNTYKVEWQDYPSGPPITAQMLAGTVDIGSMGDYPFLVNGSKTYALPDVRSRLIAITGYNLRGSLNAVVVPLSSKARTLSDLKGQTVSTSVGSAAHGMLASALASIGLTVDGVKVVNQEPSVGASALEGGQVSALAQFVPWPEVMLFRGKARKLYDGGDTGQPTMHGVVARERYASEHPEVVDAFLASLVDATDYIHQHPLEAAKRVSAITGLEAEVVYLFNGPNGIVTFDPTIKPQLVAALKKDLPFLKSLGTLQDLDVDAFVDPTRIREQLGTGYDKAAESYVNPSAIKGRDEACNTDVADPAQASEAWFEGADATRPSATPTCLLKAVKSQVGAKLKVAYVPDAATGTRMFAATASWVRDPAAPETGRLLPFATSAAAGKYVADHPGASVVTFDAALAAA